MEGPKRAVKIGYAPIIFSLEMFQAADIAKVLPILMNVGQQCTGQDSLNNYSTIIFQKVFKSNKTIQLTNALNATLGVLFTLNAT
jgi:hypothetical protein